MYVIGNSTNKHCISTKCELSLIYQLIKGAQIINYFKNWRNSRFWLALLFISIGLYTLFSPKLARELMEEMRVGRFHRMGKKANKNLQTKTKENRK